jgi:predicted ArsR family transcriptional regulator
VTSELTLPRAVDDLLGNSIRSIEELEILLLLIRSRGARSSKELACELALSEAAILTALEDLAQARLVVRCEESSPRQFVFELRRGELGPAIEQLADAYEKNRLDIISLLSQRAILRLRSGVHRMFSGSFHSSQSRKR